jgi:hypothetical protein
LPTLLIDFMESIHQVRRTGLSNRRGRACATMGVAGGKGVL